MTSWAVYFLGCQEKAQYYFYQLRFGLDTESTLSPLVIRAPCLAASEDPGTEYSDYRYIFIHRSAIDKYCVNDNNLNYEISICVN